jgi:ribosomal protein S12 methylthiotransferase accessory factor
MTHASRILDERTGLVGELATVAVAGGPAARTAALCDTAAFALCSGGPLTAGASWYDSDAAVRAALGEATERYCGHLVPRSRLRWGSYREWARDGTDAVDPATLALYRPEQLARAQFPFAGISSNEHIAWTEATDSQGGTVLVPASLVWLAPGPHSATPDGRQLHLPVNAGIAAGPSLAAAAEGALVEVVERHCLAQAWHGGRAFPLVERVPGYELREVPCDLGLAVALAAVTSDDGLTAYGCGAGPRWEQAAAKARAEATFMVTTARLVANGLDTWERPRGPLAPHRADGRYARSYRPDLADATDITCHLQLLADPSVATRVAGRLAAGHGPRSWSHPPGTEMGDLHAALDAAGLQPLTVDLTTPDVASCGLAVARVVVPGLRATGPAAFPYLGDGLAPLPGQPCRLPVPHV